eukprot:gnl/TRDRNA2_/TRDRNA2_88907_c0_seq1.p1 gnl/TRDRNA2_/TRDRNA2_88907_c0~~gnl/TRDRNA2_/TRDRNA2_88907_c0_seq1.p1  ORF type:complete len:188 (-),score=46.27 gnl/TRDRNA2_/TRDRNA2_88907_c0_seq1:113-676(-)
MRPRLMTGGKPTRKRRLNQRESKLVGSCEAGGHPCIYHGKKMLTETASKLIVQDTIDCQKVVNKTENATSPHDWWEANKKEKTESARWELDRQAALAVKENEESFGLYSDASVDEKMLGFSALGRLFAGTHASSTGAIIALAGAVLLAVAAGVVLTRRRTARASMVPTAVIDMEVPLEQRSAADVQE